MPLVALGVLVVVGSSLTFAVVATHLGSRQPVLAVTRPVPAGGVLGPGDVTVARVSTDPTLHPLAGSTLPAVLGRTAAVALVPGTLLTAADLGPSVSLGAGNAAVGLALKSGQYPPDLAAGQTVRVVDAGTTSSVTSATAPAAKAVVEAATVTSISPPAATSTEATVVGLLVPDAKADQVAGLAAAGRLVLVEVAPRP